MTDQVRTHRRHFGPNRRRQRGAATVILALVTALGCGTDDAAEVFESTEALGEALFFDTDLSLNRTQACATCHDPDHAFIDPRPDDSGAPAAFSVGDDGHSVGGRNAPTAAYAAFAPTYHVGTRIRFSKQSNIEAYSGPLGGMFWDGRAANLEAQAGGPPLNPIEMGMPDQAAVVERLTANPMYAASFERFFGGDVFDDDERAYEAMTAAIASFERTDIFAPFDAKYDRALRGEETLSFKELTGRALFFGEFASCAACHQLHSNGDPVKKFEETFTGYEYHNVGTPARAGAAPDIGLAVRPDVAADETRGQFKVPTLRNIAVTGPYMHNRVFRELRTVIEFYDKFVNPERTINPETGQPWAPAEFPATVSESLLKAGRKLQDFEVEAFVCFLRTLTDAKFEPLIPDDGIDCDE